MFFYFCPIQQSLSIAVHQFLILNPEERRLYLINFFKNHTLASIPRPMDNLLPQFQPYKERIPQFVIKLYHILEQKEYSDYLTWNGTNQILIKQPKKLQDKVLPHFFRHRHLSSFIRQLNMYKFSKVVKLVKERNYMYFRNEHFKRGEIKQLLKIKRNTKKSRKENMELEQFSQLQKSDNISIDQQLKKNGQLSDYKSFVRKTVQEIAATLKRLEGSHPEIKQDLVVSLTKCNELLEAPPESENYSFMNLSESDLNAKHPNSAKFMAGIEPPVLFPSQFNF